MGLEQPNTQKARYECMLLLTKYHNDCDRLFKKYKNNREKILQNIMKTTPTMERIE